MESKESIIKKIIPILMKNKIKKAGLFGSFATGEQHKDSDVDILVEAPEGMGFAFFGIHQELEEVLGKKVDVITYNSIHPRLRKRILSEEVKIL